MSVESKKLVMESVSGIDVAVFDSIEHAANTIIDDNGNVLAEFAIAINAEKIMLSRRDPAIYDLLQSATLRYADGIGVVYALRKKGCEANRIPGCDLWERLMSRAGSLSIPVYLVGGKTEILDETVEKLKMSYGVHICGYHDGYFSEKDNDRIIADISSSGTKIVCVAMGSPRQERFMSECRKKCPDAFYMGLGGAYDVYTGHVTRAPVIFQNLNIEWLYRLLSNPRRAKRQLLLIPFLFLLLTGRL